MAHSIWPWKWVKPLKRSEKSRLRKELNKQQKQEKQDWEEWFAWQSLLREFPIEERI